MLANIVYSKDESGVIQKAMNRTVIVPDGNVGLEISALQSQLLAFQQGEQTQEIVDAINNYTAQITFLQGL